MGNFSGVEVVHPLQDLFDELSGLLLAQRLLLREEIKQLTSRDPETAIQAALSAPLFPLSCFTGSSSSSGSGSSGSSRYNYSQLQNEHHVGAVLIDVVQHDDVGVLDLLQDLHLPLDLLPPHPPRAGQALPLFDELGGKLQASALLPALLHDGKLPAVPQRTMIALYTSPGYK